MKHRLAMFGLSLLLAGVGVLALAAWGPTPAYVRGQIDTLSPLTWILAGAGMLVSYCLRAMRLYMEWHPLLGVSRRECLRIAVFHTFSINVLPMRAGEASYPLMLKRSWNVPLLRASLSLLWMRCQDISVVAMFSIVAFLPVPLPLRIGAVAAIAAMAAFAWKSYRPGAGGPASFADGLPRHYWQVRLAELSGRIRDAAAESRGGWRAWVYCVAIWVVKFSVLVMLLSSLTTLPPGVALCGVLGGEFASALPIQPALGAGTYEAGVAFGAAYAELGLRPDSTDIIGAAIAVHLFMLVMSVGTAVLVFVTGLGQRRIVTLTGGLENFTG